VTVSPMTRRRTACRPAPLCRRKMPSVHAGAGEEEQRAVVQLLLRVTGDPESHFQRIGSIAEAETMLDGACRWLRKNAGEERFALFGHLCHVVCIDGVLTDNERSFMLSVAKRLSIPAKSARDTMHEVLSGYVKTKGAAGMAAFGLGGCAWAVRRSDPERCSRHPAHLGRGRVSLEQMD